MKDIILKKPPPKNKKTDIIYMRIPHDLRLFVDKLSKKLEVTRSETIRRLLEDAQKKGVNVK